jgi:hypothetical protein
VPAALRNLLGFCDPLTVDRPCRFNRQHQERLARVDAGERGLACEVNRRFLGLDPEGSDGFDSFEQMLIELARRGRDCGERIGCDRCGDGAAGHW